MPDLIGFVREIAAAAFILLLLGTVFSLKSV